MKFASNIVLVLATMVLAAGIILTVQGFPGTFLAIGLGTMGIIVGIILKAIMSQNPEGEDS